MSQQIQGPSGGHSWFSSLGKKISQAWSNVSQAVGRVFSSASHTSTDEHATSSEKTGKEEYYEYARKEVKALEKELGAPLEPSEKEKLIDKIAKNALQKQQKQEEWKEARAAAEKRVEDLVRKGRYYLPEEHKEALIQLIAIHSRLGGKRPTQDIHETIFLGKTGEVMTLDIKARENLAVITLPYGEIIQEGHFGKVLHPLILTPRLGQAPIICKMGLSKEEKVAKEQAVAKLEQEIAELEQQKKPSSFILNTKRLELSQLQGQLKLLNEHMAEEEAALKNEQRVMETLYSGREEGEEIPGIPPPYTFVQRTTWGKDMQETTASSPLLYATYYNNGDFFDAIANGSFPQDLTTLYDMTLQLAQGMEYAHAKSVFLRDIKLENLLWNKEGKVAFTDFGHCPNTSEEAMQEKDWQLLQAGSAGYFIPDQFEEAERYVDQIQKLHTQIQELEELINEQMMELSHARINHKVPARELPEALEENLQVLKQCRQNLAEVLSKFNQLNSLMDSYNFCIVLAEMFLGFRLVDNSSKITLTNEQIKEKLQNKRVDAKVIDIIMRGMDKNGADWPTETEIVQALQAAKQAFKGRTS